jgi:hypothetical protein
MLSGRVISLMTHNGTYFKYNRIKKLARGLSSKSNFIGD